MTGPAVFEAHNSPWRLRLLALLGLGFVALGAWLVGAFGPDHPTGLKPLVAGWGTIMFFGLCTGIAAWRSTRREVVLRLDEHGTFYSRWSDHTIPWDAVARVHHWSMHGQKMVGLELRDPAAFPGKGLTGRLAGANRALTGVEAVWLTTTGTDRSHQDLAAAIDRHASARRSLAQR